MQDTVFRGSDIGSPATPPQEPGRPRALGPAVGPGDLAVAGRSASLRRCLTSPRLRSPRCPGPRRWSPHRRAVVGLIVALAVAACLAVAVASGSHVLDGFDTALTDFTRGWADPLGWPVDVVHVIGLVTAPFWSALAATALVVVLLLTRHRAAAGLLAMSGIAGVTVSETVKMSMGRARPPGAEQFEPDLNKSFPSGHAMEGIYLYVATGLVLIHLGRAQGRRWMEVVGRILVVVGPLIGLSRLVLGIHGPAT